MIYKNKAGIIMDESKVGTKTAEDWASQGYYLDTSNNVINSSALQSNQNLTLPPPIEEPNYQATISSIATPESILNQPTSKTEQNQDTLSQRYLDLIGSLEGKPRAQSAAEEKAGLPGFQTQLTDVNAQLQSLQKEALAIPLQMQQQAIGQGTTIGGMAPIQTSRLRENAIKSLGLSSIAQTLQGNISNAQAQANRAVELEFGPKQAEIDYLKEALRINEDKLTREDAKAAELQKIKLEERQAQLDQQKEDKKTILSTANEAAKEGMDSLTLQNISNAKTPLEAEQIYASAVQEQDLLSKGYIKLKPSQLAGLTEIDITRLPNGDIYKNPVDNTLLTVAEAKSLGVPFGTTKADAATKGIVPGEKTVSGGVKNGVISSDDGKVVIPVDSTSQSILAQTGLSIQAFAYLTQGTPALTRMTAGERKQYMDEAGEYLNRTGTDIATFKSQYNALGKTVEANSLRNNQAAVAEAELDATIKNLRTAADEASFQKLRWVNVAKLFAGKEVNDSAVLKYAFHLQQLREEFAMYNAAIAGQIDANGNIREITDADYQRAENIIKEGITKGGIDGFENALTASRSKMQIVLQNSIDAQNKQVWKLFGVGEKFKNKTIKPAPVIESKPKIEQGFWSKAKNWLFGD